MDAAQTLAELYTYAKSFPIRHNNLPTHVGARDAMAADFSGAGLTVWRQDFHTGFWQQNVCAAKLGVVDPETWVVAGGHFDSTTHDSMALSNGPGHQVSEGAYDDGSGTRMMISLAKAWASIDSAYSVLFCAFDGEERGLQGSREVKRAMDGTQGSTTDPFPWTVSDVRGMLNLDMFGLNWPLRSPIYCETGHSGPLRAAIDAARLAEGVPDSMFKFKPITVGNTNVKLGTSDHVHWQNADIPFAFFIADFSELGVPGTGAAPQAPVPATPVGAYPFWHQVDTYETMTAMAGGPETLEAGFQTALNIAAAALATMSLRDDVAL